VEEDFYDSVCDIAANKKINMTIDVDAYWRQLDGSNGLSEAMVYIKDKDYFDNLGNKRLPTVKEIQNICKSFPEEEDDADDTCYYHIFKPLINAVAGLSVAKGEMDILRIEMDMIMRKLVEIKKQ